MDSELRGRMDKALDSGRALVIQGAYISALDPEQPCISISEDGDTVELRCTVRGVKGSCFVSDSRFLTPGSSWELSS